MEMIYFSNKLKTIVYFKKKKSSKSTLRKQVEGSMG